MGMKFSKIIMEQKFVQNITINFGAFVITPVFGFAMTSQEVVT